MLQDHIVSFQDGFITLQHEAFKDAGISKKITLLLKFYPGVKKVQLDADAGTLAITYDDKRLDKDKVMELLGQGETWLKSAK